MGIPIEKAVHVVGGLLLENIQARTRGLRLLPEALLHDEELYTLSVNEFRDLVENCGGRFDDPTGDFQQQVVDHVTRYLEGRGHLA
ncbi:MAG TPA: hypothetical protein VI298_08615 [Geobacteraceae bacterium]